MANKRVLDECQLKALEDAHSRYMALIGITGGEGFPESVLESDKGKYPQFVMNSQAGVPVECSKDFAEFSAELTGLATEVCRDWLNGVFCSLNDEDLEMLDSAYRRYMTLIGSGDWGIAAEIVLADQQKYARFIKPFDKTRLVFSDTDCAEFASNLTGIPINVCSHLLVGKF